MSGMIYRHKLHFSNGGVC